MAGSEGKPWVQMLWDAGVGGPTRTACLLAGCDLQTSGVKRNSAKNTLSFQQRAGNFKTSSKRIRVENYIGIVKGRFQILGSTLPLTDLGHMDKIVKSCFLLHNFGPQIIF